MVAAWLPLGQRCVMVSELIWERMVVWWVVALRLRMVATVKNVEVLVVVVVSRHEVAL